MFANLEEELLRKLIAAEDAGKPLTHKDLGTWTRGSTFEDLWAGMDIVIVGQERNICCIAAQSSQYIASPTGKWRIAKLDALHAGKPVPPYPKAQTVYL